MTRRWSAAAEEKLRRLYATETMPRLAFLLKRSENAISQHARKLGLTRRRFWTKAEIRILRKRFPHEPTKAVAHDLKRPWHLVAQKALALGLHKTRKYMATEAKRISREHALTNPRMIAGRFKKGTIPPNKGQRRPGWSAGRMAETQFKKGRPAREAHNYVPIGTEKIDPKRNALVRKVTDDPNVFPVLRWQPVAKLVWEAANGPVPEGHVVRFRDGMKTLVSDEITLDRLELVSLAENMRRNTIHNYPKEIADAMRARGVLNRVINRKLKESPPCRTP